MKQIKIYFLMALCLTGASSCEKENRFSDEIKNSVTRAIEVRIQTGSATRTNPEEEAGKAKENIVSDGWFAFAKNATGDLYTCRQATGSGAQAMAAFQQVPTGSKVYVIANASSATLSEQLNPLKESTSVTLAQIESLVESVQKADLNRNNKALQESGNDPDLLPMLMSAVAEVPAGGNGTGVVPVTLALEREYAKVRVTISPVLGPKMSGITLCGIDSISVHRVANRIAPFHTFAEMSPSQKAEWYIKKTPYVSDACDISMNEQTPAANASDLVFRYPAINEINYIQRFYVTPNYSAQHDYATIVVITATLYGTYDGQMYGEALNPVKRYYSIPVYDPNMTYEEGVTMKNSVYHISARLNGIGKSDIGPAVDPETPSGNEEVEVTLQIKDWGLKAFEVEME